MSKFQFTALLLRFSYVFVLELTRSQFYFLSSKMYLFFSSWF